MCEHKPKVNETRSRSFLKAVTARILEVLVDTLIFSFVGFPLFESFGLAILVEFVCFLVCYILERIWNKVDYGRKIINNPNQKT